LSNGLFQNLTPASSYDSGGNNLKAVGQFIDTFSNVRKLSKVSSNNSYILLFFLNLKLPKE